LLRKQKTFLESFAMVSCICLLLFSPFSHLVFTSNLGFPFPVNQMTWSIKDSLDYNTSSISLSLSLFLPFFFYRSIYLYLSLLSPLPLSLSSTCTLTLTQTHFVKVDEWWKYQKIPFVFLSLVKMTLKMYYCLGFNK
jgi:hypothetical protein